MRLVDRQRHPEAVTSRPMLLGGVARRTKHAGQNRLHLNLSHARADKIKEKLTKASQFLRAILTAAEQLSSTERWRRILAKIFEKYLDGRPLGRFTSCSALQLRDLGLTVPCQLWPAAEKPLAFSLNCRF